MEWYWILFIVIGILSCVIVSIYWLCVLICYLDSIIQKRKEYYRRIDNIEKEFDRKYRYLLDVITRIDTIKQDKVN